MKRTKGELNKMKRTRGELNEMKFEAKIVHHM
jgi:hypothetical protein